ncbi:MAG: hypothetical protein M0017_00550 [Desulfobacteraceae bacterium]|nr:hypothetical protein [Desulfobacteraceae bacterium]
MDNKLRNDMRKVEEALARFHRRPIDADPGDFWQARVMSLLLKEGQAASATGKKNRPPGRVAWRFAMAASLAAVLMVGYAVQTDMKAQDEVAELSITAPSALDIATAFGVLRVGEEL